ncbi:MAG: starch-binding protein [Prevotella sp.]|nr:starch-binding protein [Prevotella sp.]
MKKRISTLFFAATMAVVTMAQGWPSAYDGVMLQGFYWDGFSDAKWSRLEKQADDLAQCFDLVWIPQSANCGGTSMGYDDLYWFSNYNSSFGTEQQLRSMIATFKSKGIGTIADVVINHRKNVSNWVDFPKEEYQGVTYQLQSTDICADDDKGATKTWASANGYSLSASNDTGEGWDDMRDLDHNSANVQANVKAYLKMLIQDFGYTGFRYDMVKGYSGSFTKLYNEAAGPKFSVGECWDSSNTIRNWIDATSKTSAAFDFQFRYTVRNAINNNNWNYLKLQNDDNWPLVSQSFENGSYRQYAVTFVENHDTEYRSATDPQNPIRKDTLAANAYLLAMPGTPCVFLKHWQVYKDDISKMIAVRKAVGLQNTSSYSVAGSGATYFAVQTIGTKGELLAVVGSGASGYTPAAGWEKALSGYHYAYYVKGIQASSIVWPTLTYKEEGGGDYSGIPSFCTIGEGETAAFFEAPDSWAATINVWAWMKGGDGKDYVGTGWPGVSATLLGTADNGNNVWKWKATKTTAPDYIIFNDGSQQTADLTYTNGGYYTKDGLKATVSPTAIQSAKVADTGLVKVYALDGRFIREASPRHALDGLKKGVYIINNKKFILK